jgi:SMI1/KNR4 family protein SUKH-1
MEQFEQILVKYGCPRRVQKPSFSIDEIEAAIGFKLPSDYAFYTQNYLGFEGSIREAHVRLWGINELMEQNKGYGIIDNLANTLGIGTNGGGEFIAIELLEIDNYRVVLSPFIDLDKKYHIEIGSSFSDFLIRLDQGQEWFNQ